MLKAKKRAIKKMQEDEKLHKKRPRRVRTMDRTHKRCDCGGITGICGTQEGEAMWRLHQETEEHQKWFEKNVSLPTDEIHEPLLAQPQ